MSHAIDQFSEYNFRSATPHESGIFLSQTDRNPVTSDIHDPNEKTLYDRQGISIYKRPVEFEDGAQYDVTYSKLSHTPKGLDGIASYEATAWLTRGEGIYVSRLIHLGKLGIEGSIISSPKNLFRLFTVTENGRNQNELINWQSESLDRDPRFVITTGISQGGMNQQSVIDQAINYNRTVLYADAIVPCLADGVTRDALRGLIKAPNELRAIKSIAKTSLKALWYLPRTLDISKEGLYTHAQAIYGLTNGDTGKHYRNRPETTFGHMEQYDGDFLAQAHVWQPLNAAFPNESFQIHDNGCHIDCVGKDSHENWHGRLETVSRVLAENPNIRSIASESHLHNELRRLSVEQNSVFAKQDSVQ
ncbi:TPA: hypothetical protein DDX46_01190 [Candidatus Saccharibacteria bacterium]|nr:MAG: hypothetical protein UW38_C0001G0054 [Candidatus Saccharibacteria bacterium GW2011_GWC2_44_17]OGL33119.1 MAG: hypothetical protein A3E20_02230 [Candidatus Saccharibacteria bacterium RIFCSPHIGHO2_12_FULL_47_16]HBH77343.1 hypothetical protein [Candidatus Saccharibacteria bacterium]